MSLRTFRTFQAMILASLGIFLLSKVWNGNILFYINQRFVIFVLLAGLGFIVLSQVLLRARPPVQADEDALIHDHDDHDDHNHGERQGWVLWLVALPVLMGILIPKHPLGTNVLENRGINTGAGIVARGSSSTAVLQIPSSQRSVLDWYQSFYNGLETSGEMADITGFVYHDARLGQNQFMVGRFIIICCVADASAIGLVVGWNEASALPDNGWVRVRGPITEVELDGQRLPLVQAQQVDMIPEPEQPYLFP